MVASILEYAYGLHVNRRIFSVESKKKLRRPGRTARPLER
jgi:hypothetical protein